MLDVVAPDGGAEVPHGVHLPVLRQILGEVVSVAGENVDDTGGKVGALEHLEETGGAERKGGGRNDDAGIAADDSGCEQGHKVEERAVVRAGNTNDPHGLVDGDGRAVERGLLHGPPVFVCPSGPVEEALHRGRHLTGGLLLVAPWTAGELGHELLTTSVEVLRNEVKDLRPVVRRALPPAGSCLVRRLHRVPDVLPVALRHLPEHGAVRTQDNTRVLTVWSYLLAADEHLVGAVHALPDVKPVVSYRLGRGRHRASPRGLHIVHGEHAVRRGAAPDADILVEPLASRLAAVAAFLHAAEPGRRVEEVVGVDPDDPRADLEGHVQRLRHVLRPYGGRQPKGRVVGQLDGLGRGAEGQYDQHRPEDLINDHLARRLHVRDESWGVEEALPRHLLQGALVHRRALVPRYLYVLLDARQLGLVHDGADVHALVERTADAQVVHAAAELGDELRVDVLLDEEARAGAAHLSLVEPDGVHDPLHRRVQVGVVKHHHRGLPPQLQGQLLARSGRTAPQQLTNTRAPGERHLVHIGVVYQGKAKVVSSGENVYYARRQSRLSTNLRKQHGRQAGGRRGLQHHRVTHGQRRGDLPRQHQ
mmetsp:Transcript_2258/g.6258  ORF Transcript_2258/g.6258 Transcript_2258/m.6258 type:complete len:591 (-) Transcript_2258:548-2320(-)